MNINNNKTCVFNVGNKCTALNKRNCEGCSFYKSNKMYRLDHEGYCVPRKENNNEK